MFDMKSSRAAIVLSLLVIYSSQCSATIDLSNVDLLNFKYFKNLPSHGHGLSKETILEPIMERFQKAKAVLVYFRNVLFGNPLHEEMRIIEFDPHFGDAWQPYFEHHYGPKGAHLIEALGRGHSHQQLKHYGAIPEDFEEHY